MKEIGAVTGLEALNLTAVVKLSLTGDGYIVWIGRSSGLMVLWNF